MTAQAAIVASPDLGPSQQKRKRPERRKRDGGGVWAEWARGVWRRGEGAGLVTWDELRGRGSWVPGAPHEGASAGPGGLILETPAKSTVNCRHAWKLTACGCSFRVVKVGCGRADCVSCAGVVTKRRGDVVAERLKQSVEAVRARFPGVQDPRRFAIQTWTLTLPAELYRLAETPEGVRELRRATWELVRDAYGAAGAVIIPHPVGDTCACGFKGDGPHNLGDGCRPRWHPHVNVLWWTGFPSIAVVDPHLLRRRWRGVLWELANPRKRAAKRAPVELEAVGGPAYWATSSTDGAEGLAQVHAKFTTLRQPGVIAHRAAYNARSFPGWSAWAPKWVQWFGEYVKAAAPPAQPCSGCSEKERELASGRDAVVDRLRHLESHQETGPPLLDVLDDGHEIPAREHAPSLPGDRPWRIGFQHFHAELLVDVLGIPLEQAHERLELIAAKARARELVRLAAGQSDARL